MATPQEQPYPLPGPHIPAIGVLPLGCLRIQTGEARMVLRTSTVMAVLETPGHYGRRSHSPLRRNWRQAYSTGGLRMIGLVTRRLAFLRPLLLLLFILTG